MQNRAKGSLGGLYIFERQIIYLLRYQESS